MYCNLAWFHFTLVKKSDQFSISTDDCGAQERGLLRDIDQKDVIDVGLFRLNVLKGIDIDILHML